MYAVDTGDIALLDMLLAHKPWLDFTSSDGLHATFTPLLAAVHAGRYDVTEKLLDSGASVNYSNFKGDTPLMLAASQDNMDICWLLLNSGAEVNASCFNHGQLRCSAMDAAAKSGHYEIASLMLELGANISVYDPSYPIPSAHGVPRLSDKEVQMAPMKSAILHDHPRILELFLDHFNKAGRRIPWEQEFNFALFEEAEGCAAVIIRHGCYPVSKPLYDRFLSNLGFVSFFDMASNHGFVKLMAVMIGQNPNFLQEEWLVDIDIPVNLNQHTNFVSWLIEKRKETPCLKQLCKAAILGHMSPNQKPKIKELRLPKCLKEYLHLVGSAYEQDGNSQ